jgi:hypothetical protein
VCVCDNEERECEVGADVNGTMLFETIQVVGLAETVRTTIRLWGKPMNLCACDNEELECEVGADVNTTMLFDTLQVVGLSEADRTTIRLWGKPMNLCAYDNEELEREVGADVNGTMLLDTLQVVGLAEAARTTIRLWKKPMNLCVCDTEDLERGVGADVNGTMLFETLQVVGLAEAARTAIRLRKKPMNLCSCDSEECECGVGADVNDTMLVMSRVDLLGGGTDTSAVSQRSESGQRIMCVKEDIGKYDMWYGVVCKTVMSSCMSVDCSLPGGHDTVSCVAITTFPQLDNDMTIVYYETIKRNLNKRLIYECRCDERLKGKDEGSTCLIYTGLCEGLENPKIETRLINERFVIVMGECAHHRCPSIFKIIRWEENVVRR